MLHRFKQPFPAHTLSGTIRMGALIGLFVAVFLLVFQPFGMREAPGGFSKMLAIAGYGLVTFGCIALSATLLSRAFPGWFRPQNWTVGKEIQITLFNFLLIGFCNTLYTFFIFRQPFSLSHLFYFEGITLAVGILPVSLIVLYRHNQLLHANLKLAREMNAELKPHNSLTSKQPLEIPGTVLPETQKVASITFTSETGTDQIILELKDFLFATAADNYAEVHFLANGQPKKSLIRSSLNRLEETVKLLPQVVRCHRAYLVNLDQVHNFSGNAQGLKLELNHTPKLITVSRKMVPEIKTLLHS